MAFTFLCLVLALTFATESLTETSLQDKDVVTKFDGDYDLAAEKDEVEFTASDNDVHQRVKRLQQPAGLYNLLNIMTFNIGSFSAAAAGIRTKDEIIARVSYS